MIRKGRAIKAEGTQKVGTHPGKDPCITVASGEREMQHKKEATWE